MINKADVVLIKDAANLITLHRALLPDSFGTTNFERPSILAEPIEKMSVSIDVNRDSQRVESIESMTTIGGEGVMDTSTPALASTSATIVAFTFPLTWKLLVL